MLGYQGVEILGLPKKTTQLSAQEKIKELNKRHDDLIKKVEHVRIGGDEYLVTNQLKTIFNK